MATTLRRDQVGRVFRAIVLVCAGLVAVAWCSGLAAVELMWLRMVVGAWQGRELKNGGIGFEGLLCVYPFFGGLAGGLCLLCLRSWARRRGRPVRVAAWIVLAFHLALVASVPGGMWAARRGNEAAKVRFDARTDTLIAAIGRYEKDHQHPPPRLQSLVPDYVSAVPGTGLVDEPRFGYRPRTIEQNYRLAPPGNTAAPLLEVFYTPWSGAVEVKLWRTARDRDPVPARRSFDAALWRQEPGRRVALALDLIASGRLLGRSRAEVAALLGAPEWEGWLFAGRWRLTVGMAIGLDGGGLSYQPDRVPPQPWRGRWNQMPISDSTPLIDAFEIDEKWLR
ncbi:MAG: hypothetical protein HZB16_11225 [Armatimonadetes bacterium]|nr:hypothetical protein [Armatimonadota bacterium]